MTSQPYTTDNREFIGKEALGYMVNAAIAPDVAEKITALQTAFKDRYGEAVWLAPVESLHVTLLDWLAPIVDYDKDKDELFDELFTPYDIAMTFALAGVHEQYLVFNRLIVSPQAIAIVADNAAESFNAIRQKFLTEAFLSPRTKQPPTIVHCTIARFTDSIALPAVESFANDYRFEIPAIVSAFQLVRETKLPMLGYRKIKEYPLATP